LKFFCCGKFGLRRWQKLTPEVKKIMKRELIESNLVGNKMVAGAITKKIYSTIIGTGCYLPTQTVHNRDFIRNEFYQPDGTTFDKAGESIVKKFEEITEIQERRYVSDDLVTSDISFFAAREALESSQVDAESLDYIIVAHNFGDLKTENRRSDFVPSLAARVKHRLAIKNPKTIAYDLCFGCPGWLQGLIQANYYLKSGDARRALVIGAETLSRISDPYDRDSMLYADGAGAVIVEAVESREPVGILSHTTRSDTLEYAYMLRMGPSNNPAYQGNELFLKMNGHKLYEYALNIVPQVVEESLTKVNLVPADISKVLLHQANGKMDLAILKRLFKLYGQTEIPEDIMPMIISKLGNSSVATIPTLLDMLLKGKLENHLLKKGDKVIFVSVGAGMNVNSVVYRMP
jgi:3-oxoacyl-[acyl-carrier-protein] synthase-3